MQPALPASRNILEKGGVRVRIASQSDDTDRDADRCQSLEQSLIVTRLLGIRRIGEQHDVPRAFLGLLDHFRGCYQRGVGEDAAAHGLDAPDVAADPRLVAS